MRDLGPGESPHDRIWLLGEDRRTVFSGDQAYNHVHGYLADGHWEEWLANLDRLAAELPGGVALLPGHGDEAGLEILDWQREHIERFVASVRERDWSNPDQAQHEVAAAMKTHLPNEDLAFLMELSIAPDAASLGLTEAGGAEDDG